MLAIPDAPPTFDWTRVVLNFLPLPASNGTNGVDDGEGREKLKILLPAGTLVCNMMEEQVLSEA